MKRIGDILIEHNWVDRKLLERAYATQRAPNQRMCSFLVESGVLEADDAARALGELHGVPAVLQKHLDHRVKALAKLIPADLAREQCVLPIGRMGGGELIVCARDPKPELRTLLAGVSRERVVLAVALASRIEALVVETYGSAEPTEFDVDLTTGPIVSLESIEEPEPIEELPDLSDAMLDEPPTAPAPVAEPIAEPTDAFGPLNLVGLDDRGVSRDLAQSGAIQIGPLVRDKLPPTRNVSQPTLPPTQSRPAITLPPAVGRTPTSQPARTSLMAVAHPTPAPEPPDDGLAAGTVIPSRAGIQVSSVEMVIEKAMQVAGARWQAALLLAIKDRVALGHRGHGRQLGTDAVRGVAIPLTAPSIVKAAYESGRLVTTVPDDTGAVQDRLEGLLGLPRFPAAMPIATGGVVAFILVVGDPIVGAPDAAARELERLGTEFSAALARLAVT